MIAILGGGIAGVALARELALRGAPNVRLFDPAPEPGTGSTGRALGGFRTQHGSDLNVRLSLRSRRYFEERAGRIDFQPNGYLYLADSPAAAEELRARAEIQGELGLPIEHPDPQSLVPFLRLDGISGANFCGLDALYRPPLVLACMAEEALAAGAELRYGDSPSAAELDSAQAVVVAAGAWSGEVGRTLGVQLAVEPLERRVFQVGPFDWLPPGLPMTLEAGSGYHFRARDQRLLVMGPGDQGEYEHFAAWLRVRAPEAAAEAPETSWAGNYELTFDGHPLAGATERPGVWASCGFSGHGVMHAPAVAESLAAMILGMTPALDLGALTPLRTEPLQDRTQL